MPRVDFYIMAEDSPDNGELFACRLAEKAWRQNLGMSILCTDEQQRQRLDQLMWSQNPDSFIPHNLSEEAPGSPITLLLSDSKPQDDRELLIRLGGEIPSWHDRFQRIAEIVSGDPQQREKARRHYRYYRDQGYPLQNHFMARR